MTALGNGQNNPKRDEHVEKNCIIPKNAGYDLLSSFSMYCVSS